MLHNLNVTVPRHEESYTLKVALEKTGHVDSAREVPARWGPNRGPS